MGRQPTDPADRKVAKDDPSRYARRSAHLPHLGDEAGREALRSMRGVTPR
jgi:hypothetical protein